MNGILVVNKSVGFTSRDIVNAVGKSLNTKKIGHTGTLDPNASGVLVLCLGNALKMCELMDDYDKEYIAEIVLGVATDTLDMDTNATILEEKDVNIPKDKIIQVVDSFKGEYEQQVPIYSAVKVNGKKLYEYARNNIPVDLPSKKVAIKDINVISGIDYVDGKIIFKIKCTVSKGTYIRALIRDIGIELKVPSVMKNLVRTRIGNFKIENAYSLEDIKKNNYQLINVTDAFSNIKKIVVSDDVAFKVKNGVIMDKFFDDNMVFIIDKDKNLLALYSNENNKCRPYKMFI